MTLLLTVMALIILCSLDASGLFETWGDAYAYKKANKLGGSSIEYDSDANLFKIIDGDVTITQVGNMINKMYMIGDDMHLSQTRAGGGSNGGNNGVNPNAIPCVSCHHTTTIPNNVGIKKIDLTDGFGAFHIWGAKGSREDMTMKTKKKIEERIEYIDYNSIGLVGAGGAKLNSKLFLFEMFNALQVSNSAAASGVSILEDQNIKNGTEYIIKTLHHQTYESKPVLLTKDQVDLLNDYSDKGIKFRDSLTNKGYYNTYTP